MNPSQQPPCRSQPGACHWLPRPTCWWSAVGRPGIAAASCAARHGARTLLVERYGFLGGMGTAGGVTNFAGLYGKRDGETVQLVHGVVDELLERIERLGGLNAPQDGLQGRIRVRSYDIPAYKCAADQLLLSAKVQLLFHALLVDVLRDDGGLLDAAIVETKSGRGAIRARWFVDASGDADLAHHAGVPYELGDGHGDALYPSTMFRVGAVDAERALGGGGQLRRHRRADARCGRSLSLSARRRDPAPAAQPQRVAGQRHAGGQCARAARWMPPMPGSSAPARSKAGAR